MEINYKAEKTIRAFHKSNAFVRGVRGPIGCLSASTEFFTGSEWKRIDEYSDGDMVGQWNNGLLEMVDPSAYVKLSCNELISFSNKHSLSMEVSEEHRMPLHDWKGDFCVKKAVDVERKPSKHKVPINYKLNSIGIDLSDNELRLAIAIHADGHFHKGGANGHCVFDFRKNRKKERIEKLFGLCGVYYRKVPIRANRPTEQRYIFHSQYVGKRFDAKWYMASQRQAEIILEESMLWDGLANHEEQRYYSTYKSDADYIQFIAHACGRRATISRNVYDQDDWKDCYTVHISVKDSVKGVVGIRRDSTDIKRVKTEDGFKYCFSVPSTFFIARHNGRIFVTGNSGKSVGCCLEILLKSINQTAFEGKRRSKWGIVRGTYGELRTTTISTWLDWFDHITTISYGHPIHGMMTFPLKDGTVVECELIFLALDHPKDVKKLKSLELTGIFFNEAAEIHYTHISMGTGRVNRYPSKNMGGFNWSGVIMDTNSPDEANWWHEMAENEHPDDWEFFDQPGALINIGTIKEPEFIENPEAENIINHVIGVDYYFKQLAGKPIEWVNVFLLNQYGSSEPGAYVYANFGKENHSDKEFDPGRPINWSFDWNFVPQCSGIIQEYGDDAHAVDEFVIHGAESKDVALEFVERYKEHKSCPVCIYGDADGNKGAKHGFESNYLTVERILKSHGFRVYMKVPNSNGPIKDGQNSLRAKILDATGKRSFFVNPKKCPTISKLGTIQLKKGSAFLEDRDMAGVQDIGTAIRYYINSRWPIKQKGGTSQSTW